MPDRPLVPGTRARARFGQAFISTLVIGWIGAIAVLGGTRWDARVDTENALLAHFLGWILTAYTIGAVVAGIRARLRYRAALPQGRRLDARRRRHWRRALRGSRASRRQERPSRTMAVAAPGIARGHLPVDHPAHHRKHRLRVCTKTRYEDWLTWPLFFRIRSNLRTAVWLVRAPCRPVVPTPPRRLDGDQWRRVGVSGQGITDATTRPSRPGRAGARLCPRVCRAPLGPPSRCPRDPSKLDGHRSQGARSESQRGASPRQAAPLTGLQLAYN